MRWRFRRGVWVPTRGLAMKGFFVAHASAVPLYLPEATSGCPSPARAGPLQERRKRIASQPHTHQKLKNHSNHHVAVLLWPQKLMSGQLTQFSRMNRRFRMNSNTMHPYTTPSGPLDLSLYLVTGDTPSKPSGRPDMPPAFKFVPSPSAPATFTSSPKPSLASSNLTSTCSSTTV